MVKRLPANQRDSYLIVEDFDRLLEHSGGCTICLVMLYYTECDSMSGQSAMGNVQT